MSYNYGSYGYTHAPYNAYQPAGGEAQPECKLTLEQLLASVDARQEAERILGQGGEGIYARWWKVAVELSKQPVCKGVITLDFIQNIEASGRTGPVRAKKLLDELIDWGFVTGEMFIQALEGALLERLAQKLRQVKETRPSEGFLNELALNFFCGRIALSDRVALKLACLDEDQTPLWKRVATMLSIQLPEIDGNFISKIENYHSTAKKQAETFLNDFFFVRGSTVRVLLLGMSQTSVEFKELCQNICVEAKVPEFFKRLEFPPTAIKGEFKASVCGSSASVANDQKAQELAASRNRVKDLEARVQEMSRRLEAEKRPPGEKPASEKLEGAFEKDDDKCVVCLEREKRYVVIPCGHISYCEICVQAIKNCALCRSEVTGSFKTFSV